MPWSLVLTETLGSDGEACRTRYLYRITDGGTILSFTPAQGAGDLLAWRRRRPA